MGGGIGHVVVSGPMILAAPIAAAAGAITFLSPCVLPLVPGYLSYVTGMSGADAQRAGGRARRPARGGTARGGDGGQGNRAGQAADGAVAVATKAAAPAGDTPAARGRTIAGAALFVLGFSAEFALVGGAFGSLGFLLRDHAAGLTQILGGLTIVLGLLFAGVFERFPVAGRMMRPSFRPRAGLAGAPLLGAMFGLGWTPCIGPTLTLVTALSMSSGTAVRGATLMFIYGLGLGLPFLLVAAAFQRGMTALRAVRRHARLITGVGGAMLVAVGLLEVTGVWSSVMAWLQSHWAGYQTLL